MLNDYMALLSALQAWLRVALGYHTWEQVGAGLVLGGTTAYCWFLLGARHAFATLQTSTTCMTALFAATGAAIVLFTVKNVLAWMKERQFQQLMDSKAA